MVKETDFVGGLAKGLKIIEVFGDTTRRLAIADAAKATGLDRATARRCLLTLTELGYAHYDGKFFTLTPRILRLGHAYLSATPLPQILQPFLDNLSDDVGESVSASVLEGMEIVYIARAAQKRVMSVNLMPGSRLPAYCTSMGRVLLAALPTEQAMQILDSQPLVRRTPKTEIDRGRLEDILMQVRRDGYAAIDEEVEMGLRSVAVPIFNTRGNVIAALNVGLAAKRESIGDVIARFLPMLLKAQAGLSSSIVE